MEVNVYDETTAIIDQLEDLFNKIHEVKIICEIMSCKTERPF